MFKIRYRYQTGDSFHRYDLEEILEYEWEDIQYARESLQRIKEHYLWYESKHKWYSADTVLKPKWHNVKTEDKWMPEESLINLRIDKENEVQFWPPWCGYFETLYNAEIILDERVEI